MAMVGDPLRISEAFSGDAVEDEYLLQIINNTWEVVEHSNDRKVIGNCFVFRTKKDGKKKLRLAAKGTRNVQRRIFSQLIPRE